MGSPYVGEIRLFAGNFAPAGWAFCNGAALSIAENDTLFNLIGTTYGGDGQNYFNLPDLRGRIPVHPGQGPGISQTYNLGDTGGVEAVTLTENEIPSHSHVPVADGAAGSATSPQGAVWAESSLMLYEQNPTGTVAMANNALAPTGGDQPHDNMPPFLAINFIISLYGIYPTPT